MQVLKYLTLILTVMPFGLTAAEQSQASHEPVLQLQLPDCAATRQHFKDSVYGLIWSHPALTRVRRQVQQSAESDLARGRPDVREVLKSVGHVQAILFQELNESGDGSFVAQADLGSYSDSLWQFMERENNVIDAPESADAAVQDQSDPLFRAVRYGSNILFTNSSQLALPPPPGGTHDLEGSLHIAALFELLKQVPDIDIIALNKARKTVRSDLLQWHLDLTPIGLKEQLCIDYSDVRMPGAVDPALFDSLPARTLLAAAFYFDGANYRQDLEQLDPRLAADLQPLNDFLEPLGTSHADLIARTRGTCMLAVTPSVPFPAVSIILPRTLDLDAVVGALLQRMGKTAPAEGEILPLVIPRMPPLRVARNDSHWILSSDALAITNMVQRQAGGFNEGVLAEEVNSRCTADTLMIGVYDTRAMLNLALGYAAMLPMPNPEMRMQLSDLIKQVQERVEPGFAEAHWVDNGVEVNGEGFFGGGFSLVTMLGLTSLTWIGSSQAVAPEAQPEAPEAIPQPRP